MRNLKLQSAMEYLMTYGWAILIIAVVMVALFSLGILGGSPLSTTCIASSGYTCSQPILHSGAFNAIIGQATGTQWTAVNMIFVPQGASAPTPPSGAWAGPCAGASGYSTNTMAGASGVGYICPFEGAGIGSSQTVNTGQQFQFGFGSTTAPAVGTSVSGVLDAYYQINGATTWYQTQVAAVNLKAL